VSGARTAAVFAHFDPGGQVADHVHRYLAELSRAVDVLVVVSTSDLDARARSALSQHGRLLMRANEGYDFASWKAGLELVGDLARLDRVVLANDSVIGPVRGLDAVLSHPPAADFWGMTASVEIAPHLQSWFVVYEGALLRTGLVQAFWAAVQPESHRYQVVRRYEIGQSRLMRRAGIATAPWFRPDLRERAVAEVRYQRWLAAQPAARRRREDQVNRDRTHQPGGPGRSAARAVGSRLARWNPGYACWDAALTGRLPFVKTELLRDDPMGIDSEAALRSLEAAYPAVFDGVRDHLDRTRSDLRRLRKLA